MYKLRVLLTILRYLEYFKWHLSLFFCLLTNLDEQQECKDTLR